MEDKVIVITGPSQRLGLFLTKELCKSNTVIAITRNSSIELNKLTPHIDIYNIIHESEDSMMSVMSIIKSKYNSIDLIINNASYYANDNENYYFEYQKYFDVHMRFPYLLIHELSELLYASKSSLVVQISDYKTDKGSISKSLYLSTKSGLENLTKSLSKKHPNKIRFVTLKLGLLEYGSHNSSEDKSRIDGSILFNNNKGFVYALEAINAISSCDYIAGSEILIDGGLSLS